jgi:hypothetical protein
VSCVLAERSVPLFELGSSPRRAARPQPRREGCVGLSQQHPRIRHELG